MPPALKRLSILSGTSDCAFASMLDQFTRLYVSLGSNPPKNGRVSFSTHPVLMVTSSTMKTFVLNGTLNTMHLPFSSIHVVWKSIMIHRSPFAGIVVTVAASVPKLYVD